jgi:CHAD domain-containing protein
MFGRRSSAFSQSLELVAQHLPGVRDGNEEAIHQARVEIRRARELLALAGLHADEDEAAQAVNGLLKQAGRALGRARDADVVSRLLHEIEARVSPAANLTALLLSHADETRDKARRQSIKKLEQLDFENEIERLRRGKPVELGTARDVRRSLPRHLAERATTLKSATERAGGVRFPGRLHKMRIAVKHLRYAIDLADEVSLRRPAGARRLLKRTQAALGNLHDWGMLAVRIREETEAKPALVAESEMLAHYIRAELATHHADYLQNRATLLALCETLAPSRRWPVDRRAVAAAAVAVPSLVLMINRRAARAA